MRDRVSTYQSTLDEVKSGRDWTSAERAVLAGCKTGEMVVLGHRIPDARTLADGFDDATDVRAELIRWLLRGGDDLARPHPKGVRIEYGYISGKLDFQGSATELTLYLLGCRFAEAPSFRDASIGGLLLPGCHLQGLDLHRAKVAAAVLLSHGFQSTKTVSLSSAQIGSALDCNGGKFDGGRDQFGARQVALQCAALVVGASVFMCDGFKALGTVMLRGAKITGQLDCNGGRFDGGVDHSGSRQVALDGNALEVGASVFLSGQFRALGSVIMVGAQIGGSLACNGGRFDGGTDKDGRQQTAFNCNTANVRENVFLHDMFQALGTVNLASAQIGGQLACNGARFEGGKEKDGRQQVVLQGDNLVVEGSVTLTAWRSAKGNVFDCQMMGPVNFGRAKITGNLECQGAVFDGEFNAEAMYVGAGFFWQAVRGIRPMVNLAHAHIGVLRDDVASWDDVVQLNLAGFRYDAIEGDTKVSDRLKWLGRKAERAMPFADPAGMRAQPWLGRVVESFDPQPYTQLAKVLNFSGQRHGAARVLAERERRLRHAMQLRVFARLDGTFRAGLKSLPSVVTKVWDMIFGSVFGFGYLPVKAFYWSVAIILTTWIFASQTFNAGQFAPSSDVILTSADWGAALEEGCPLPADMTPEAVAKRVGCVPPLVHWVGDGGDIQAKPSARDYETFSPWLYALDLFLPLDALGQQSAWAPSKDRGAWGWWGYYGRWVIQLSGWLITAVGAAVVTGLVGKKED